MTIGVALAAVAVLAVLPAVLGSYAITVFIFIFFYAYLGQAWNIVGGYAGQLSVGHAAFVGVGAYTTVMLSLHERGMSWLSSPGNSPLPARTANINTDSDCGLDERCAVCVRPSVPSGR